MKHLAKALTCLPLFSSCQSNTSTTTGAADTNNVVVAATQPTSVHAAATRDLASEVIGTYKTYNDSDNHADGYCDVTLIIKKKNSGYAYVLTTERSMYSGTATFKIDEDNEVLVSLNGIHWKAEGQLDSNEEPIAAPILFDEVSGALEDGVLTFQNYGNSMNYYVKFGECGQKYVQLRKE